MKLPNEPLSPAQQEIMEVIWEKGEVAAVEVRECLADGRQLARKRSARCSSGWKKKAG